MHHDHGDRRALTNTLHEQLAKLDEPHRRKPPQDVGHVIPHGQLLAGDMVVRIEPGALENIDPGLAKVVDADVGLDAFDAQICQRLGTEKVAPELRQGIELLRCQLHLFVLEQATHEFRARILGLFPGVGLAHGQQHARLDFDEHGRHQQVFAGKLKIAGADLIDVRKILPGHLSHRNVEDVEVLFANQVEQQIQRSLEGLKKDLERIRRDVEIGRHREQGLAIKARQRHGINHIRGRVDGRLHQGVKTPFRNACLLHARG